MELGRCLGRHCNVDQGGRIGLLEKMTFEQFKRERRSAPGGSSGEEHSRHSD